MSQLTREVDRLDWDLVDRLHKALRVSGVGVAEMASALGVHRNTVGTYLRGRIPDRRTLVTWAITCGVPLEWLITGKLPDPGTGLTREYILQQAGNVISLVHPTTYAVAPEAAQLSEAA